MAIITLSEYKTFPMYNASDSTQSDAVITALIPIVEADFLLIRNAPFDTEDTEDDSEGDTVYPDNAKFVAAEMIYWNIKRSVGVQSESYGDYSFTADEMTLGYPRHIVAKIEKFVGTI
jgi:hypothetical protein